MKDNVQSSGWETPALVVLNAAERERHLSGVTVSSPGCCAEELDTPTHRRVKTSSAIDLFVSYSFAHSDSSRYCSRFSMGKTTSRGKCLVLSLGQKAVGTGTSVCERVIHADVLSINSVDVQKKTK